MQIIRKEKSTPSVAYLPDMTRGLWGLLLALSHEPGSGGMSPQLSISAARILAAAPGLGAEGEVRCEENELLFLFLILRTWMKLELQSD